MKQLKESLRVSISNANTYKAKNFGQLKVGDSLFIFKQPVDHIYEVIVNKDLHQYHQVKFNFLKGTDMIFFYKNPGDTIQLEGEIVSTNLKDMTSALDKKKLNYYNTYTICNIEGDIIEEQTIKKGN